MTSVRTPVVLDAMIDKHKAVFGRDPLMVTIRMTWYHANTYHFRGKVHTLCCNKGYLYRGIPMVLTHAGTVDDFLICY